MPTSLIETFSPLNFFLDAHSMKREIDCVQSRLMLLQQFQFNVYSCYSLHAALITYQNQVMQRERDQVWRSERRERAKVSTFYYVRSGIFFHSRPVIDFELL